MDEDAAFVKEVLGLSAQPWELSPVVVTAEGLQERLAQTRELNLMDQVKVAAEKAGRGQDVLLLEGGASLREGYVVCLPTPLVAQTLGSHVLVMVKYRDPVRLLDDALAAATRLGELMVGIILNRVPQEAASFVNDLTIPFLENHGVLVFGSLPQKRGLEAITVEELRLTLQAQPLTRTFDRHALVESLTVGAMTAEAAISRFRRQMNKAAITGSDRTDIQLAALETSTTCQVLTGNLQAR